MNHPIEVALIGAGNRGTRAFGGFAHRFPSEVRIIAVAEPLAERREHFADEHDIDPAYCFASAEEMFAKGQLAPALINATMDTQHLETTLPALALGYHVLLEKPMATTPHECVRIVQAAEQSGRILQINHVLRYAPFYMALQETLAAGRIGDLMTVHHKENVAFWHMAHSFVRGNWGNLSRSSPMILAKCCHDMDLLRWLVDRPCVRVASFGELTHFRRESVGPEIPDRCTDGCPIADTCPYYAPRLYLGRGGTWPANVVSPFDPGDEAIMQALRTGPYGRCVYRCDNDVVDHQVAILEFAGGVMATFVMDGFTHDHGRTVRYDGTHGTLRGREVPEDVRLYDHVSGREEAIAVQHTDTSGHGGGDAGLLRAFLNAVRDGDASRVHTSARASLDSHLMAFAAEKARLEGTVVDMAAYARQIEQDVAAGVVSKS